VVSFAVCSAREILADHGVGIVVPQGDYPSLVRTLRAIAHERARLADMSARAQVVAKTLSAPGAQASAYKKLLGELCHARRVAR
jgi:UDP-N-acetylglucosamine:LPS N-acetylglucosamine transferase